MSLFDGILSRVSQHADVDNLATKVGLSPDMAEKAIAALGMAHQQPGDTVDLAAAKTGIDTGTLSQIIAQIGGEGSLSQFAQMIANNPQAQGILGSLDKNGDGSVIDDLGNMAKGFFNKT